MTLRETVLIFIMKEYGILNPPALWGWWWDFKSLYRYQKTERKNAVFCQLGHMHNLLQEYSA